MLGLLKAISAGQLGVLSPTPHNGRDIACDRNSGLPACQHVGEEVEGKGREGKGSRRRVFAVRMVEHNGHGA